MVNQTKELFVSLIYFLLRLTAIFKMRPFILEEC